METNLNLWLIPLLPLAGAALNGLLGRRFSKALVSTIALLGSGAAFAWVLFVASRFAGLPEEAIPHVEHYGTWFAVGQFSVPYAFMVDQLTMIMLLVVTGVGFLIHIYSVGYMSHEGGYYRFFSYLNLFMFFMLMLVLSNNYLLMFVGWEGVGLASYLLIGFFFIKDSAASAGKKAFIVNRIGDFAFLIAIFLLIKHFGSVTFSEVFAKISALPVEQHWGLLTWIGVLLMGGACGKSAQIPLYVWLPDAMEGPTPVSALIHAATMVTAGVYMVTRSNPIFWRSPDALMIVAIIGTLTALFAATIGLAQNDIKRVLAYSTVSQLGYMFMACGVAAFGAGIFHLMTHAFFKALLFLGAGSVIHALGGEQDMRRMGGLRKEIPYTFWTMTFATFAIAGFFPFAGFFSKDEILWRALTGEHGSSAFWAVGLFTAFLTSFYMFRLWFMTFFGRYRGNDPLPIEVVPAGHGHGAHGGHDDHAAHGAHGHDSHDHDSHGHDAHGHESHDEHAHAAHGHDDHDTHGHGGHAEDGHEQRIPEVRLPAAYVYDGLVSHGGTAPLLAAKSLDTHNTHGHDDATGHGHAAAADTHAHAASSGHGSHGHGHGNGHIHESPMVMIIPLAILAILSLVGGWIGWPAALGGANHFEHFLEPVVSFHAQVPVALETESGSTEVIYAAISMIVAFLGFSFAWLFYYKNPELPNKIAAWFGDVYVTVRNKYYIDEIYQAVFVKPLLAGSRDVLWHGVDQGVIDGTVNNAADGVQDVGGALRHMQSGNIRSYAGWVALGAACIVVYMMWLGAK
jgi:NADH-quinone oxidoreductase subunit L